MEVCKSCLFPHPPSHEWQALPDMLLPRCTMASAVLAGHVYAIGGQTHRTTQRCVEAFDLGSERWVMLDQSPMSVERKYTAVGGRLVGGEGPRAPGLGGRGATGRGAFSVARPRTHGWGAQVHSVIPHTLTMQISVSGSVDQEVWTVDGCLSRCGPGGVDR